MAENDELKLDGFVSVDDQIDGIEVSHGSEGILDAIDKYLSTERFSGDDLITLSMPESILKRNKEKINSAIWYVYGKASGSGIKMIDILIALESMLDANKMSVILDNAIKLVLAKERGITISEEELEKIAEACAKAGKKGKKSAAASEPEPAQENDETEDDGSEDENAEIGDEPSSDEPEEKEPDFDINAELDAEEEAMVEAVMKELENE